MAWTIRIFMQAIAAALVALGGIFPFAVEALPSFAQQTGMYCANCHIGGFGPQLTPYGMRFKLGGYTQSDGKKGKVPLAAMLIASWTHTDKAQDPPPEHFDGNDNSALQEVSVFLAGRLADHVGSFVQATYSGIDRKFGLDNADVRYASSTPQGGRDTVLGITVNNNPTIQDPLNTLPGWRFPFVASELVPGYATPIVGNLGQSVLGVSGYAFWDNSLYAELGVYNSLSKTALNVISAEDRGKFKGAASYWRLAYLRDRGDDNFSLGLFGFNVDVQPDRTMLGTADKYRDLGVDASYQYLGSRQHIFAVNGSYMRERQRLDFTAGNLGADQPRNTLDEFRLSASYYYQQTWGITAGWFDTHGSIDNTLNASSLSGRPNTSGYVLQADWSPWGKAGSWQAPWANVRLGVQYTGYQRFNGGARYLDDNGNERRARDNNTIFLFLWTAI